jgi:nitrogen fixation/metabolism regulation signal transduction histidine kinase
VQRLRNRLIVAFLAATLLPLTATIWITLTLLDRSLSYATTGEIDRLSRTLEATVRQFYQREREALRQDAAAGVAAPVKYAIGGETGWPDTVRAFWDSREAERFGLSGPGGDHVSYLRRDAAGVAAFTRDLRGIRMEELTAQLRQTRELLSSLEGRDLRQGFTRTLFLLLGAVWMVSLAPLVFIAHRISRPIQQLTEGLTDFAAGDWSRRIDTTREDEVGRAVGAFNHMAEQLRQSRERLIQLTQMASWQSLARKTAHELKNSLTPIRLTVEEIVARQPAADRSFMDQAVHIVVSEIDSLERRVRAFSDFASEPPASAGDIDVNALIQERISLLKRAYPDTMYHLRLDQPGLTAHAGSDLVKGILMNLLQNAAEAAGPTGAVLVITRLHDDQAVIEVHDSGPGLSAEATATLFEPTITFKKQGMGLGLSIAKKNALLSNGDVALIPGELPGAAFRVTLPLAGAPA